MTQYDMIDVGWVSHLPHTAAWIYPTTTKPANVAGWYWKYRAIDAYHGPFKTREEAYANFDATQRRNT